MNWYPNSKIDVIVSDHTDYANGSATAFPSNKIKIFVSEPELHSQLNNFEDNLRQLFIHEFTHILNMDTAHGIAEFLRSIVGSSRLFYPNTFLPIWLIEGNAVYEESIDGKNGRNNSTLSEMIIRNDIYYNNIKSISEASSFPRKWPAGSTPYLYGGKFIEFIEKNYKRGSIADYFHENGYNILPWSDNIYPYPFFNNDAKVTIGKTFPEIWSEFIKELKTTQKRKIEKIKSTGLSNYKAISNPGASASNPVYLRNGDIVFSEKSPHQKGVVKKISIDGETSTLCETTGPNSITELKDEEVLLLEVEIFETFSLYNEAFVCADNEKKRITSKLRGKEISAFDSGKKVLFIRNEKGRFELIESDNHFRKEKVILSSDLQLAYPEISPNGKMIVFSVKDRKGFIDLFMIDRLKNEIKRLTDDYHKDITPRWHPNGNKIVFSSDRSGVYNLYELNIVKNKISMLTNLIGGAFFPSVSNKGDEILFLSYEKNGNRVAVTTYPEVQNSNEINSSTVEHSFFSTVRSAQNEMVEIKEYSSLKYLKPSFFWPLILTNEYVPGKIETTWGFIISGQDPLAKHSYILSAGASTTTTNMRFDILYMLSSFYPEILFRYFDDTIFLGEDSFPYKNKNSKSLPFMRDLERSGAVTVAFPFISVGNRHLVSLTYSYEKHILDIYQPDVFTTRSTPTLVKLSPYYSFSNTNRYPYSISSEDGIELNINASYYSKSLGSDLTYYKARSELSGFLPGIFDNNVLMIRVRAAKSNTKSDIKPYNLGRFIKGEDGSVTEDRQWGLRGYPAGIKYGSNLVTFTAEYKFPLFQTDQGYKTFPFKFKDFWLALFADYGDVWTEKMKFRNRIKEFRSSAGVELHTMIDFGYSAGFAAYIGYSKGFNNSGEHQFYFAIGTNYEGAFKAKIER